MRRVVAIAAAALVLATGADARPPNACALLTKAETARLLGSDVSTRATRIGSTSSCVWTGASGSNFALVSLDLTEGADKVAFEYTSQATPGAVAIHRVGQMAFRVQDVLWVYSGRYRLKFASFRLGSAVAVETAMAKLAVRRL